VTGTSDTKQVRHAQCTDCIAFDDLTDFALTDAPDNAINVALDNALDFALTDVRSTLGSTLRL
jgi:hypothetical protein